MLNYMLNAQVGFTPAAVAPRCDNSRTGFYVIIAQRRAAWGDRHCPLLHSYQHLEFHINGKGILQSQKITETFYDNVRQ